MGAGTTTGKKGGRGLGTAARVQNGKALNTTRQCKCKQRCGTWEGKAQGGEVIMAHAGKGKE